MEIDEHKQHSAWSKTSADGVEIWDTEPVFLGEKVSYKDQLKLLFYPKKYLLYRWIQKHIIGLLMKDSSPSASLGVGMNLRILDVGCGTGASVIDLKKMFGRAVEVIGVDVVHLQVDLAKEKIKKHGVWAEAQWYDGERLPFPDQSFDAIYTSDVLGHVKDVRQWLSELHRVLKPGGALAMFAESKLGKHAFIRNYLYKRGLNVDPHEKFHISLYSKATLIEFLESAGFEIKKMYSAFWASFFVHPDEYAHKLRNTNQHKFLILRTANRIFCWIKKKTHPYSTALCELYGLIEMLTVGRWVEAQGYVILAKKVNSVKDGFKNF